MLSVRKILKVRRRGDASWQAEKEIHGFREDGTDLVILDNSSAEVERYQANHYESWIVEARIEED